MAIILLLFGVSILNAQTNLNGRYSFKSDKGSDPPSFYLTFERQDSVYYSYFYEGGGTIGGKWTLEEGSIKVVLKRGDDNWTIKLKQKGDDLEISERLPETGLPDIPDFKTILPVGTVFKRIIEQLTGPALTPEVLGKKVLKLVKSIRTLNDISPNNLKRQTGINVSFNAEDRNRYGFGGNVTDASDWSYGFLAYSLNEKDRTNRIRFDFNYQLHEPLKPDTTVVCKALEFNSVSEELQQAGFSAPNPSFSNHGYVGNWTMERGKVFLRISVEGGFYPKVNNCVMGIDISITK